MEDHPDGPSEAKPRKRKIDEFFPPVSNTTTHLGAENPDQGYLSTSSPPVKRPKPAPARKHAKPRSSKAKAASEDTELDENGEELEPVKKIYADNFTHKDGIEEEGGDPHWDIRSVFNHITDESTKSGIEKCVTHLNGKALRIGTMCSGTESPVLALGLICEGLKQKGMKLETIHVFSAEIVAWKQYYIEKNFSPPKLFADITEFIQLHKSKDDDTQDNHSGFTATTAYGGKAEVPGCDILVAGFSCVDFSSLNNSKKELEDRGESGDTFFATLAYIAHYLPGIVILENVLGAPWKDAKQTGDAKSKKKQRGIDFLLGEIGYASRHMTVDSKDHGTPQTRQRGYLIAIHKKRYPSLSKKEITHFENAKVPEELQVQHQLAADLEKWGNMFTQTFGQKASIPAAFMVLRSDDPIRDSHTEESVQAAQGRKAITWAKCKIGHENYRDALDLGKGRKLTNWVNGGSYITPDFYRKDTRGFVERTLDTLEIAHLRNLRRGFDDRYYSRFLELSQNVYRVFDNTRNGIIGCLTPTGIPFLTSLGLRLTGEEALIFQGLLVASLDLSMLSQANLQDLAGNAMTSTVVGSAMLAGLCVFYKVMDGVSLDEIKFPTKVDLKIQGSELLVNASTNTTVYNKWSVADAQNFAKQTRRLCYCEGRHRLKRTSFQSCAVCKHTTCSECGKSPPHHYEFINEATIKARQDPSGFSVLIKQAIPARISLSSMNTEVLNEENAKKLLNSLSSSNASDLDLGTWDIHLITLQRVLTSTVSLNQIRRAESWEITYESLDAVLILTISEAKVQWQLFANVRKIPLNDGLSKYMRRYPIARMTPSGGDLNLGVWQFWLPKEREWKAELTWKGPVEKSFRNNQGLDVDVYTYTGFDLNFMASTNEITKYFQREIRGRYRSSQQCGQPMNSLHYQVLDEHNSLPTFFYLEQHGRTGFPDKRHNFVFTDDIHRLEQLEERSTFAELPVDWRAPMVKLINGKLRLMTQREIDSFDQNSRREEEGRKKGKEVDRSQASRIKLADIKIPNHLESTRISVKGSWIDVPQLSMLVVPDLVDTKHLPANLPIALDLTCKDALAVLTLEKKLDDVVNRRWILNEWHDLCKGNESDFVKDFGWLVDKVCPIQGHQSGDHSYHMVEDVADRCFECKPERPQILWKTVKKKNKIMQVPFEDRLDGTNYEKAVKNAPLPLSIKFMVSSENLLTIKANINPVMLVHKAVAILKSHILNGDIEGSWRLITTDDQTPTIPSSSFYIPKNVDVVGTKAPNGFGGSNFAFREEQERAFTWMNEREKGEVIFVEEEVVEARAPGIKYRIEARAQQKCEPRGGLLSFDVGFGKTVLILALTAQFKQEDADFSERSFKGRFTSKATVVFCPGHLADQWETEAIRFSGTTELEIIKITSVGKFKNLTVQKMQEADLIIVALDCLKGVYQDAVANFAGMVEFDKSSSVRAKKIWYEKALIRIRSNVALLKQGVNGVYAEIKTQLDNDAREASETNQAVPTQRIKGAKYECVEDRNVPKPKKGKNKDGDEEVIISRPDIFKLDNIRYPKDMSFALLELFHFARIVIDEFPYADPYPRFMLEKYSARSRWLLSGTPPKDTCEEVRIIARLLGIYLGTEDFPSMKPPELKEAFSTMTAAEQFQAFSTPKSRAWYEQRNDKFQSFLSTFARTDFVDLDRKNDETHHIICELNSRHIVYSLEGEQRACAGNLENLIAKNIDSDVEHRLQEFSGAAKESLLQRASHCSMLSEEKAYEIDAAAEFEEDGSPEEVVDEGQDENDDELDDLGERELGDLEPRSLVSEVPEQQTEPAVTKKQNSVQEILKIREAQEKVLFNGVGYLAPTVEKTTTKSGKAKTIVIDKGRTGFKGLNNLLKEAVWLSKNEGSQSKGFEEFQARIRRNEFGDGDIMTEVDKCIGVALRNYKYDDWKEFYHQGAMDDKEAVGRKLYPEGPSAARPEWTAAAMLLKQVAVTLNSRTTEIVHHRRSLRLVKAICELQQASQSSKQILCSCCKNPIKDMNNAVLLASCGHIICIECNGEHGDGDCPSSDTQCDAFSKEGERVLGQLFIDAKEFDDGSEHGHKFSELIKVINKVSSTKKKDPTGDHDEYGKIILFVQFEELQAKVREALDEANIKFIDLCNTKKNKSTELSTFQNQYGRTNDYSVLILNIADASAAGSNLTVANCVIFLSPLHKEGHNAQSLYNATKIQAIGRAVRYGQREDVDIYHFLTAKTIDIDTFEMREKCILQPKPRSGRGEARFADPVDNERGDVKSVLESRIARLLYPASGRGRYF